MKDYRTNADNTEFDLKDKNYNYSIIFMIKLEV